MCARVCQGKIKKGGVNVFMLVCTHFRACDRLSRSAHTCVCVCVGVCVRACVLVSFSKEKAVLFDDEILWKEKSGG